MSYVTLKLSIYTQILIGNIRTGFVPPTYLFCHKQLSTYFLFDTIFFYKNLIMYHELDKGDLKVIKESKKKTQLNLLFSSTV